MTESEAMRRTTEIAPKYQIKVEPKEGGWYRAFPVDLPNDISWYPSADGARGMAYHSIFQAIKFRLLHGGELPPMTTAKA